MTEIQVDESVDALLDQLDQVRSEAVAPQAMSTLLERRADKLRAFFVALQKSGRKPVRTVELCQLYG